MKARFARLHPLQAALIALGLAGISHPAPAQTIFNPSFESNSFTTNPGYISGNGPITNWSTTDPAHAGLNPASGNPFANNGTVPDGTNVAFIQSATNSSLSTVISNLTVGETYKVNFRVNARDTLGNTPNLKIDMDGVNIISTVVTNLGSAGTTNAYLFFAFDFTAAATNQTMALRNDATMDATVLVDNFSIAVRNSGWSYAAWNDDASSGVVSNYTYTHAFNFGSGAPAGINGVTFTGIGGGGGSPFHVGANAFSTSGLTNVSADANNLTNGGSAALAHDFVYGGNPATLTVSNLTVGKSYVTTIYSVGFDSSGARVATFSAGNDRLTVNQDQFGNNNGIWVSYFFRATATTNTITYMPLQGGGVTFHTYGFANYESPPLQIVNPSFEADTFTTFPGYASNNFPITGWNGVGRYGVNPGTFGGPFTDNGDIPDGTKAAFIQGDSNYNGMLAQTIHGFTNGASYQVRYFENSRNCCGNTPFAEVRMGGQTIVLPHAVPPVGFGNPYHQVLSDIFVATNTTLELAFLKSNPQGGDTTLLIDNVSISQAISNQLPVAVTLPADLVTTNSARLDGQVNPKGSSTTVWFQWGTDTNYGNVTATQAAGSATTPVAVNAALSGLAGGDYHYRLVASNSFGISAGVDESFTIPNWAPISIPGLPGVYYSSVAWGDFDNDGRLDFLLTGTTNGNSSGANSELWRNTGSGFTNVPVPGLPQVFSSSVAWGDFDNDGRLDFIITGYNGSTGVSQLWRNTGSGFSNVPIPGLPGVFDSSVAWGDFDNDGRLDFLLTGTTNGNSSGALSQLWRNTGNGFTNVPIPGLPGVFDSSVAWGDFDNDGRLDFLLTGTTNGNSSGANSELWRNTGSGFTNVPIPGLPGVAGGSVAWGDFDNDGRLDFLITGITNGFMSGAISQLWRNTGSGFSNVPMPGLPGVYYSSVAWGDYDNDGRLDFLLTGFYNDGSSHDVSQLWRNTGSGFTNVPIPGLPGVYYSSVAWGDFDNDGRLDFIITGYNGSTDVSQLWRNNLPGSNTPPAVPAGLSAISAGATVVLNWNAPADDHTPAAGLNYNVRIGTTPGGSDVLAPMTLTNGFRLLPAPGNAHTTQALDQLPPDRVYYWSVQAVDTSFAGSPFATEQQFIIGPLLFNPTKFPGGVFEFYFTNLTGTNFQVLASTNVALPLLNWTNLGTATSLGGGLYRFTDNAATNFARRYYLLQKQ